MLEKFWCDILMEQVQEVVDFNYKFTQQMSLAANEF